MLSSARELGERERERERLFKICSKVYFHSLTATNPHFQDAKGNTALHEAGILGNCEILQALFQVLTMSDVNRGNLEGETPLLLAAANGHARATELLLDNGKQNEKCGL